MPTDSWFEKDLEKELNVERHEELEKKLDMMSDSEFLALLESVIRRRRERRKGQEGRLEIQYVA